MFAWIRVNWTRLLMVLSDVWPKIEGFGIRSSPVQLRVNGWYLYKIPANLDVSSWRVVNLVLGISTFQDETSTFSQTVGDQSPTDTAQNSRKTESSTMELPKTSKSF